MMPCVHIIKSPLCFAKTRKICEISFPKPVKHLRQSSWSTGILRVTKSEIRRSLYVPGAIERATGMRANSHGVTGPCLLSSPFAPGKQVTNEYPRSEGRETVVPAARASRRTRHHQSNRQISPFCTSRSVSRCVKNGARFPDRRPTVRGLYRAKAWHLRVLQSKVIGTRGRKTALWPLQKRQFVRFFESFSP
jgi:hypothetical protein